MSPGTIARPALAVSLTDPVVAVGIRVATVVVVAVAASWLLGRIVNRLIDRVISRVASKTAADPDRAQTRSDTVSSVLTAIGQMLVWTVATMLILGELGFDLAPLIAGAGIVGVAVGFGAQSLVADFLSGLFMLIEDQYGVGDWVDVGETTGVVEHVGLRTTRIRSLDGLLWTVRNGEIARTANANQGWGRAVIDVGVGYDVDLDRAQRLIHEVAMTARDDADLAPKFRDDPEVWGIQELGDDAVTIRLVIKTSPGDQWGLGRALRLRIKQALDQAGMEIPFPQRTIWLRTEPDAMEQSIPVAVGGSNGAN